MQTPSTAPSGKIIIINGPSSSGKTTLALALHEAEHLAELEEQLAGKA